MWRTSVLFAVLAACPANTDTDIDDTDDTDVPAPQGDFLALWTDGGPGYDAAMWGGFDAAGALLALGLYQGTFRIANGQPAETELFAQGDGAYWVGRFVDREMVWVRTLETDGEIESFYGSVTPDGGVAVCGTFSGALTAGAGVAGERTIQAGGGAGGFAAFFSNDGDVQDLFVVTATDDSGASVNACVRRPSGATLLGGLYEGSVTLGAGTAWETTAKGEDSFVLEVSPAGELAWMTVIGGPGADVMVKADVASDGSLVFTGAFEETVVFAEGTAQETTLTSAGDWDGFVARVGPDGVLDWAIGGGTSIGADYGWGVAVGPDDEVAVGGLYTREWTPPGGTVSQEGPTDAAEGWVARYTSDGTLDWVRSVSGDLDEWMQGVEVLGDGTIVATGVASWADGGPAASFTVSPESGDGAVTFEPPSSYGHAVVAAWSREGELAWAKWPKGPGSWGRFVAADDDQLLWGGEFNGTVAFGWGEDHEQNAIAAGLYDIALAWLQR